MSIKNTLKRYDLRHTSCRQDVLSLFQVSVKALSHGDVEQQLSDQYDRVTIYRTLKTFVEVGLIHKVLDEDGLRYAHCKDECQTPDHQHHHNHVHFKCQQCGQTSCLDSVQIPAIKLPNGYAQQEVNLLIEGVCVVCNQ